MADNGSPQIIRAYIICPDCGRSAPDAGDGLCQDCRDHARLKAAVGEWAQQARVIGWVPTRYEAGLLALARELDLVAGGMIDMIDKDASVQCYVASAMWRDGGDTVMTLMAGPKVKGVDTKDLVRARVLGRDPGASDIRVILMDDVELLRLALRMLGIDPAELAARWKSGAPS